MEESEERLYFGADSMASMVGSEPELIPVDACMGCQSVDCCDAECCPDPSPEEEEARSVEIKPPMAEAEQQTCSSTPPGISFRQLLTQFKQLEGNVQSLHEVMDLLASSGKDFGYAANVIKETLKYEVSAQEGMLNSNITFS